MKLEGGYSMIDCTGLDYTKGSTEQTITGLYAKLKTAIKANKPIIAYNGSWGTHQMSPIHCFAQEETSSLIIATASTLQICVTSSDVVTIINMIGE